MRGLAAFCFLAATAAAIPAYAQRASAVFVDAASSQVLANSTAQLNAKAFDSSGNQISSASFTWTSSNKSVFTVDGNGVATAVGIGWADLTAGTTGASGTLRLQVVPLAINVHPANMTVHAGDTLRYSADVLDANSQPMNGVALQWRAYGANSSTNNVIAVDSTGNVYTSGYGVFFIEAYVSYNTGTGPFIPQFLGHTLLTVLPPAPFSQKKMLDSGAVRSRFQLRERRGQMSVNDLGQVAYTGWLEGFATASLVWKSGAFTAVATASVPAEIPGTNLFDLGDPALNNNGEISSTCIVLPYRSCILFGDSSGNPHLLLFDGSAGGGVGNIRNFATTRFSLNDSSTTLFRADYLDIGSTVQKTGLFTTDSSGFVSLAVAAGTDLPGLGKTYTFDRDFGIANDGTVLFFATNGSSRALYRLTPDNKIARVVGTGDKIADANIVSLGNVAVGKNGQYATMANTGVTQYMLLFGGDPSARQQLAIASFNSAYAVSGAGEVVFQCSLSQGYGLYRWNGATAKPVFLTGMASPTGEIYTQFDSAGITAKGEVFAQARTANNLLLAVNSGTGGASKPIIVFQAGAPVLAAAGPAFSNFVLNSHTGNPMIKTGQYSTQVFELSGGALLPRLVSGDRLPGGWFFEGNQDVRRNGDGDLFVSTDNAITRIAASGTSGAVTVAHFPQRSSTATLYGAYQVAGNASGAMVLAQGNSLGIQDVATVSGSGRADVIAWLGTSGSKSTNSPAGGTFGGSNDLGIADDGTVYASMRVNNGPNGLFAWTASNGWTSLAAVNDMYDGRPVTSIGQMRVSGKACYAIINLTGNASHLAVYRDGAWSDLVNYGDSIPAGGPVFGIGAFDANRNGAVAVVLYGNGGVQYLTYVDGSGMRVAANSDTSLGSGDILVNYFQISLNDDNRIFATGINTQDSLVLYEFDPRF